MTAADTTRLAEIRQRCEAATDGPWSRISGYVYRSSDPNNGNGFWVDDCTGPCHDADFIAAARSDIPWLLYLVSRQEREIKAMREALALCRDYLDGRSDTPIPATVAVCRALKADTPQDGTK